MKKIMILILALLCPVLWSMEFIEFKVSPEFSGWRKSEEGVIADSEIKINPNGYSLRIDSGGWVTFPDVVLEENTLYEISFYMKGNNIESEPEGKRKGAQMALWDRKNRVGRTFSNHPKNYPISGTFDWEKCSKQFNGSYFKGQPFRVMPRLLGKGTVWFDELKIRKIDTGKNFRTQYSDIIKSAVLYPHGVFGFFNLGEPVDFSLNLDCPSEIVNQLEYTLNVSDIDGRIVYQVPKKLLENKFTIPGQEYGYYVAEADLFMNGEKIYTVQGGFTVNEPMKHRDPFFGIDANGAVPEMASGYARAGFGTFAYKVWQLHSSKFLPKTHYERMLNEFKPLLKTDFELHLGITPQLPTFFRSKEKLDAGWPLLNDEILVNLEEAVSLFSKACGKRINLWVISSEIPSMYFNHLRTWTEPMYLCMIISRVSSRIIKKDNPDAKISTGGINRMEHLGEQLLDYERIWQTDIQNESDYCHVNLYTGNWDMTLGVALPEQTVMETIRKVSAFSASLGKGKIFGNAEWGYSINFGAGFNSPIARKQAVFTVRNLIIQKASGVIRFNRLHTPTIHHISMRNLENSGRGMTTVWKPVWFNGEFYDIPLPGSAAYSTVARELAFAEPQEEIIIGGVHCYIFKKNDGSTLVTLWNIHEHESEQFKIKLDSDAVMLSLFGAKTRLATGLHTVKIGTEPIFLTMRETPEQAAAFVKNIILSNTKLFKAAGKRQSAEVMRIYVDSVATEVKDCELHFDNGQQYPVKVVPLKMNVFDVPVTEKVSNVSIVSTTDESSSSSGMIENSFITVKKLSSTPILDGSGEWLKGIFGGHLKYPENIRPVDAMQEELGLFKSRRTNPTGHNVSAEYYMGYDTQYIYLGVKVDDPIHIQRQKPSEMWRDDSIQFVFSAYDYPPRETFHRPPHQMTSDLNFGVGLTSEGSIVYRYLGGEEAGVKNFPVKVSRENNITFYEVAIPFSEIGEFDSLRFGLVIFDNNDLNTTKAPYWLDLCGGVAGGQDASKYWTLAFE